MGVIKLFNYGNFANWENCIEANKICNIRYCPDSMNCCSTNCIGTPTLQGILFFVGITLLIYLIYFIIFRFLIFIFKYKKSKNKQKMNNFK